MTSRGMTPERSQKVFRRKSWGKKEGREATYKVD
jgi:hypothetical protein